MSLRKLPEVQAFRKSDVISFEAPEDNIEAFDPTVVWAEDGDSATISIYGQIGIDPVSAMDNTERRISAALRSIGRNNVTVSINSPGGNFFNGLAIYNLLRIHDARVTVNVIGMAGSAASVIAMAGDDILMASGSHIMVHNASALILGNKYDSEEATGILSEIDASMAEIYAAHAGVETSVAAAWMDKNRGRGTMFGVTSAIKAGLATGRLSADKVKISAEVLKPPLPERVIERSLMAAANMSDEQAKTLIAKMKAGSRDAPADTVTRDADGDWTAIAQSLIETLK